MLWNKLSLGFLIQNIKPQFFTYNTIFIEINIFGEGVVNYMSERLFLLPRESNPVAKFSGPGQFGVNTSPTY